MPFSELTEGIFIPRLAVTGAESPGWLLRIRMGAKEMYCACECFDETLCMAARGVSSLLVLFRSEK